MNTPTLLTPEILTLQPDRAATGGVSSQEWGGFSSSVVFATRHRQSGWPQWQDLQLGGPGLGGLLPGYWLGGLLPGGLGGLLPGGLKVGHLK